MSDNIVKCYYCEDRVPKGFIKVSICLRSDNEELDLIQDISHEYYCSMDCVYAEGIENDN